MSKPRKLQEIFDVVIDARLYKEPIDYHYFSVNRFPCMCQSLYMAHLECLITEQELQKAIQHICIYMKGYQGTLSRVLEYNGLPSDYLARLAIYRNWTKRPKLRKNVP